MSDIIAALSNGPDRFQLPGKDARGQPSTSSPVSTAEHRASAYTWHTFTPESAERVGPGGDVLTEALSERGSKVTLTVEPHGQAVTLTMVHDGLGPGSPILEMISHGWPELLSNPQDPSRAGERPPAA